MKPCRGRVESWIDEFPASKPPFEDIRSLLVSLDEAELICSKFVRKVENGQAISAETYEECKAFLEGLNQ